MSRNGDEQRNQVFTDAENYIKQASDMLQREAARLRQEQETIDAMSKKLEHVHFSSTIQLNVALIALQQVFKRLPRIQIRCWLQCFQGSLR